MPDAISPGEVATLPHIRSRLIGRERALEAIARLVQQEDVARGVMSVQARVDADAYCTARDAGQAMPVTHAIDYALDTAHSTCLTEPGSSTQRPNLGISAREIEVLRLLVDGRSNQEIAGALCISPHTVASHVTNVMNKLGVESRTAAATFSIRHGLV